ncbi:MAG: hypothetical protein DVB25_03925 [Verrucomicrobia bacterium]|nr:MAG: hypothetical protein DVB25_03925 [Verrucomicrobiota bacterium]
MNAFFRACCLACLAPTVLLAADRPRWVVVAIRYYLTEGTSHGHVYLFDADAKELRQLTRDNEGQDHDPVFSPDGGSIVYRRRLAGGEQWRSIGSGGEGDQALEQAPAWHQKSAMAPARFDYPKVGTILGQPGGGRSYTTSKPGDIVFKMSGGELELVLKDAAHQADPNDPLWYPKAPFLRVKGQAEDLAIEALPVFGPKRDPGVAAFWTGPLARGWVADEHKPNDDHAVFGSTGESVLLLDDSPFFVVPPMRAAFFAQHRNSTIGTGLFAADLNTRRLYELSPNGGSIFPLPGLPLFACVGEQRYLPLGNSNKTVNCSYLDLWDARLRRMRFAEKKPGIFYGASLFVEATPAQVITIPGNAR